jgi:hypothetical protein
MIMNFGQEGGLLIQGCIFLIVGLLWWKGARSAAKPTLHRSEVFEPVSFKQNELRDAAVILTPEAHTGESASLLS